MSNTIKAAILALKSRIADAYTAVSEKGGTLPAQQTAANLPEAIESIPSSGSEKELKDVAFIDYDGTILESYTYTELENITELPSAPTHEGLTFLKWSETLQELKTYKNKITICGAIYVSTDGKFHIFITTPKDNSTFSFYIIDAEFIDFGDGTIIEGAGTSFAHTYSTAGNYEIRINKRRAGSLRGFSPTNQESRNMVTELWCYETQQGISDNDYPLCSPTNMPNLKAIVLPNYKNFISGNDTFINNINIKALVWDDNTKVGGTHRTWINNGLIFQTRITSSGVNKGVNERFLRRINFKMADGSVAWKNIFTDNNSLEYIWINPNAEIESMANCFSCREIHIPNSTVPSLGNTNYFTNIPTSCKIYVKTGLLSSYETATNWSTIYAQYTFVEED